MLRIQEKREDSHRTRLSLDGRLVTEWVDVLRQSCERLIGQGHLLILDLGGVSFVDRDGVNLLQSFQEHVTLTNCSPFVAEQIKQPASSAMSK